MSFKDDFLEALRSVKRDILGEPEPQDREPLRERPEKFTVSGSFIDEAPGFEETPKSADADVFPNEAVTGDTYSSVEIRPAQPDHFTVSGSGQDRFEQTAYRPQPGFEPRAQFEPVDTPLPPFPPVPPVAQAAEFQSNDARKIFDFDAGDLYDDKTVISKNTVIRGSLQTQDSIRLLGQVLGDIECRSNIVIAGKMRGNTLAANAYILDAQIDGDMICEDNISINDNAWILGNIRAQQADIDGKIKGNLEIRHAVSIGSSSSIIGNISADELEIKRGAFINGQIIMYSPSRDVIDRFEHFEGPQA